MDYRILFLALVLDTAPLMIAGRIFLAGPVAISIVLIVSSILATLVGLAVKGTMNQDRAGGLAFLSLAVGVVSIIFVTSIWAGYGDDLAVCGGMPPEFLRGPRCSGLQQEVLLYTLSPLVIIVPTLVFMVSLLALRRASE
jgi:hypothetical protein